MVKLIFNAVKCIVPCWVKIQRTSTKIAMLICMADYMILGGSLINTWNDKKWITMLKLYRINIYVPLTSLKEYVFYTVLKVKRWQLWTALCSICIKLNTKIVDTSYVSMMVIHNKWSWLLVCWTTLNICQSKKIPYNLINIDQLIISINLNKYGIIYIKNPIWSQNLQMGTLYNNKIFDIISCVKLKLFSKRW